jgi:acetyl-CoA carboxylase biotin carboxyl carrier protein
MDLDQLKQILDLVREHDLSELEVEHEGLKIRIRTNVAGTVVAVPVTPGPAAASPPGPPATPGHSAPSGPSLPALDSTDEEVELAIVKSPIVGTFYRSPEPESPAFVDIGSFVKKGQVLCIIEAMKLMNEIDSEYDGEIVNVYVETGQPVQYGERLFAIRIPETGN